jgi:hypothetical protein
MKYIIFLLLISSTLSCKNKQHAAGSADANGTGQASTTMSPPPQADTVVPPKPIKASPDEINPDTVVNLQSDEDPIRFVVLFYSIGEGSEFDLIKEFESSIKSYGSTIGKEIDYQKLSWGREGETDFCIRLTELNVSQKVDFIEKSRALLKKGKWVNIYENYVCPKRRIR